MRRLVAVVGVALALATVAVLGSTVRGEGSGDGPEVLAVPRPGDAEAAFLEDGEPAFVVAHADGRVSVLSAVGPHLDVLVVWCGDVQQFVEPGGASSFDAHGRYLTGPAPQGLAPFEATVDGTHVRIGGRRPAPPRDHRLGSGRQSACMGSEGLHGGTSHEVDALAVDDIPWSAVGRFVTVEGFLDLSTDVARLCGSRPPDDRCPADAPVVQRSFHAAERPADWLYAFHGWMQGTFVARVLPGRHLTELALRKHFVDEWTYNFTAEGSY